MRLSHSKKGATESLFWHGLGWVEKLSSVLFGNMNFNRKKGFDFPANGIMIRMGRGWLS